MLYPPALASDWVEDGTVIEMDEAVLQSPAQTVPAPSYFDIQTPEAPAEGLNMDLAEFTPGYAAAFGDVPVDSQAPVTGKTMSLPMAFAETEGALGLQPLSEDAELESRMDRLEMEFSIPTGDGQIRNRLNTVRKLVGLPPIPEGRLSWPDKFINAIGSGITGGAKAGGKAIVKGTSALASGTKEFLSTPGVPELLIAGAILGVGIPLIIEASKNSRGRRGIPDVVWVEGYFRSNGTYVPGHFRTVANGTVWDNFSTAGNYNPYTGQLGTKYYPWWAP